MLYVNVCLNSKPDRSLFYYIWGWGGILNLNEDISFYTVSVFKWPYNKTDFLVYTDLWISTLVWILVTNTTSRTHHFQHSYASHLSHSLPPPLTPGNHSSVLYPYSLVMFRMSYKWNHILWKLSDFFHSAKCLWDSSELCQQFISFYYWVVVKNPPARCEQRGFDPWVGKIPWRRKWQATPVFLPGESHGQRSLVGYSPRSHKESDMT